MPTLHGKLLSLFQSRGDAYAFGLQTETGSYRRITAQSYAETTLLFSAYLKERGVKKGDRILILSENGPEWTMAALAAMNLGAVVVPVAAIASLLEITNTIRGAKPRLSILSRRLPTYRATGEFLSAEGFESLSWDLQQPLPLGEFTTGREPIGLDKKISGAEDALLIYTSGTTGSPKGVPITHEATLFVAEGALKVIEASAKDRLVGVLPLSHMLEFTAGFVTPSLVGAPVTYIKSLKAEDLLAALKDARATIFVGVPLLFEVLARNLQGKLNGLPGPIVKALLKMMAAVRANPSLGRALFYPVHRALGGHLRFLLAGGSKLQPATFDFFAGLGIPVLQGYGLTETAPVLAVSGLHNAGADHVGEPLPGIDLGIFSEEGKRLLNGEEGEIWAKGINIFRGYLDPSHNEGVFQNGYFRTGDLGRLDEKNILRITGRKRDIIVTPAGKNIYPEEIESTVMKSGRFLEAAVLGMQDEAGHEKITLVLVPDRAKFKGLGPEEIRRRAADEAGELCRALADYKWPQRIEVHFEELPKTSTRKIKKHEVRKLLLAGDAAQVIARAAAGPAAEGEGRLNLKDELERSIAEGIEAICRIKPAEINLSDSLTKDLGLDSLTFVELVSHVEQKFQTKVEGIDFSAIQTVQDLIGALEFARNAKRGSALFSKVFFTDFSPQANAALPWRLPRRATNAALRAYLKIRHEMEVEGLENLKGGGPFVFTPNHSSHMDLISLAGSIPSSMVHKVFAVAAKDYFFNRTWKALGARALVNAIPFDRKGRVQESMARCREALASGGSLVIFPEGTRSPKGNLLDFKPGVGQLLAGSPNVRAIPVFIDGAYRIMPKGSRRPGAGKLRIRFGEPISFLDMPATPEGLRQIAERLHAAVKALSLR
ncbi:MAG: hypothetical protein EOP11_04635 [Proteobacteria bacterium]|nr:MAG: hypothetical protein EOP11_04635 [Pseudomonadota bacterium]